MLLNNWTPTQQIIYHMLRIFMKTERLVNGADNSDTGKSATSNYHIKTMMLWACELKPSHWWTDSSNLIGLFAQCLHFLKEWVVKMRGQHYFIKNVLFVDYVDTLSLGTVTATIKTITVDYLAGWFVDNYMRKCAELCPANLPILCNDMLTIVHDAAIAILRWKSYTFGKRSMERILSVSTGISFPKFRCWKSMRHFNIGSRLLLLFMHEVKQLAEKSAINSTIWWDSWVSLILKTVDLISPDELARQKQFFETLLSTTISKKSRLHFLSLAESNENRR